MKSKASPPRRLREHEGDRKPTSRTLSPVPSEGKSFDPIEQKLSLALDALLDVIQCYREVRREG
jgi:hypothetical protein